MKRLRKLALAAGTIATIAAPVAAVISCGSSKTTTPTTPTTPTKAAPAVNGAGGVAGTDNGGGAGTGTQAPVAQKLKKLELGEDTTAAITGTASAFSDEGKLTAAITSGDLPKILGSLKGLDFATLKSFESKITVDGTKALLKAIVAQVSKVSTNVLPFVDKIMEGLSVPASISDLVKKIENTKGEDKLLDLLGSQIGDLLNKQIDTLVDDALITKIKTAFDKPEIENYFALAQPYLQDLHYDSLENLGKSILNTAIDNVDQLAAITKAIPQLSVLINFIDPSKTAAAAPEEVKTYRLGLTEGHGITFFESNPKIEGDKFEAINKNIASGILNAPEETIATKALKALFGTGDAMKLVGGSSKELNRIVTTVFAMFSKFDADTLADIKTLFQDKMHFSYTLKKDWKYDQNPAKAGEGKLLKAGTVLTIKQFVAYFFTGDFRTAEGFSPFKTELFTNLGLKTTDLDKNTKAPLLFKTYDDDDTFVFDAAYGNAHPDNIYGNVDKSKTFIKDSHYHITRETYKSTDTKLAGVDLTKYGFKDVAEFASVFAEGEWADNGESIVVELSEIGAMVGVNNENPNHDNFGTGLMTGVIENTPESIKYLKGLATALGQDPKAVEASVKSLFSMDTVTRQVAPLERLGLKDADVSLGDYDTYTKLYVDPIQQAILDKKAEDYKIDFNNKIKDHPGAVIDQKIIHPDYPKATAFKIFDEYFDEIFNTIKNPGPAVKAYNDKKEDGAADITAADITKDFGSMAGKVPLIMSLYSLQTKQIRGGNSDATKVFDAIKTWVTTNPTGTLEECYKALITDKATAMNAQKPAFTLKDVRSEASLAALKILFGSVFEGSKNILGTQDVSTSTGKGLLE